jgi:ATP-dependent Clp protease adaptor protein ClpS
MSEKHKPRFLPSPELTREIVELCPRHKVLVHNDDKTHADFVVMVLMRVFRKDADEAIEIMSEAHHHEVALVEVVPLERAEFHVDQAHSLARTAKFPLTFSIEQA